MVDAGRDVTLDDLVKALKNIETALFHENIAQLGITRDAVHEFNEYFRPIAEERSIVVGKLDAGYQGGNPPVGSCK